MRIFRNDDGVICTVLVKIVKLRSLKRKISHATTSRSSGLAAAGLCMQYQLFITKRGVGKKTRKNPIILLVIYNFLHFVRALRHDYEDTEGGGGGGYKNTERQTKRKIGKPTSEGK